MNQLSFYEFALVPHTSHYSAILESKDALAYHLIFLPFTVINHPVAEEHLALTVHHAIQEFSLIDHLFVIELHLAKPLNQIVLELSCVHSKTGLEFVDPHAILEALFELSIIQIAVLVLDFALAMQQAALENALVLRPVFVVDHALSVLRIVFPFTHVHVAIRVLAESIALELPIDKVALIPDAAILDEHAKTIVLAVAPFTFIVLALVLPHIDTVAVEVVFCEFTLESMTSAFEDEDAKAVHDGWCNFINLEDFSNVLPLGFFETNLFNDWFIKETPYLPFFVAHTHVLIVFSEYHVKLLSIERRSLEGPILISETLLVFRIFSTGNAAAVNERYQFVGHSREKEKRNG